MAIRSVRPVWCGLGIAVCLVLWASTALADSNARIVRLSYAQGDVRLDRGDGRGFELAVMNMPVAHGNRVWARNDALAEVEFEDGDTIRLTPETLVILHELSLRNNGIRVSVVELQEGEAYFHLRRNDDNDFRILLPGRELELRKSSRLRIAVRGKQVELAVMKGEVEIRGDGERLLVKKGETLTLDPNDADRYYLARSVNESSYDEWDKDRDSYRDRYASSSSYSGYSSLYSYGVSDLNYYGGYFNVPGYGLLWRPYYVNYGWSPFDNGAWVYYPGYGYIWVSAYPWGWTPYRYGSWYYIGGHGWCWRPGSHWNRWNSFTPVDRAPRNFTPPVVPQDKNVGIVNVGRGPRPIFPDNDRGDRGAPGRNPRDIIRAVDDRDRGGKGFGGREGITPRLPSAGDPNSEVVGKRSSGQPIVFPSRSRDSDEGIQRVDVDRSGGIGKGRIDDADNNGSGSLERGRTMDRDSGGMNKGRSSAPDIDDSSDSTQPGRVMDLGGSSRKSFTSDATQSSGRNHRDSTPRAEPSGRSSAPASSGRSTSSSPAPARSYSPSPSSAPRSYGGSSGGASRGASSGGGASKGSSGSTSRGTTR